MKEIKFKDYKKLVESIKYKDFSIKLDDIAKYPGEFFIEYKYEISCPNWENSGIPGTRIIFSAKPPYYSKKFVGFTFDKRQQLSKTRLTKWLKEVANKVRYKKIIYN